MVKKKNKIFKKQAPPKIRFYWKPWVKGFSLVFFLIILIMAFLPEEEKVFSFSALDFRWEASPGTRVISGEAGLTLIKTGSQLYLSIPSNYIDADKFDVAEIEISGSLAFDDTWLLFRSPYNQDFKMEFGLNFDSGDAGRPHSHWINLRRHGAWQGAVTGLLILPSDKISQFSIREIKFLKANLWHKLVAIWDDFARYYDPRLGTCFAMASPLFINQSFNSLFIPVFGIILGLVFGLQLFGGFMKIDKRIYAASAMVFFGVAGLVWGTLDLRNNHYYLKAIGRNINLYWGKSELEKRGTVVGDLEFIKFMQFCDQNIPLEAKLANGVPINLPGTPSNYLSSTQFHFNLRPRFTSSAKNNSPISETYYIFYKNPQHQLVNGEIPQNLEMFLKYSDDAYVMAQKMLGNGRR